jgi:hypothetical protein
VKNERIGKKEQWIEKNGGMNVRWDGLEWPSTKKKINYLDFLSSFFLPYLIVSLVFAIAP